MSKFIELTKLYEDGTEAKFLVKTETIRSIQENKRDIETRKKWNDYKTRYEENEYRFDIYDDYYKFMKNVYNKGTYIEYEGGSEVVKESYDTIKELLENEK